MPMTLLFIGAVLLAMWVLYDTGALLSDRMRLQNTADHVAYSTAGLVARDLNFIAYTNRAMAANQVGIAQMVGLSAWAASMDQFARNANTIGQFIPGINAITGSVSTAAATNRQIIDQAAAVVIPINDQVIGLLSDVQRLFHQSIVLQLSSFSADIGRRNDPDARSVMAAGDYSLAEAASLLAEWNEQIGQQNTLQAIGSDDADAQLANRRFREFEQVVIDSRDPFSANRSYQWDAPFSATWGVGLEIRTRTPKFGGTDFIRDVDPGDSTYRWDWAAMDTVSQYVQFCVDVVVGEECWDLPEIPLAWGAAHALDESRSGVTRFDYHFSHRAGDPQRWGDGAWRNRTAASALLTSESPNPISGDHVHNRVASIRGLQPFHALLDDTPRNRGPAVIALYIKDEDRIASQRQLLAASGGEIVDDLDARATGGLAGGRAGAVAKAEVYFMRPTDLDGWRRADNRVEYGNLYNPFWQVRLVDLSDTEKLTASAIVSDGAVARPEG
ncbi:pilus assembly protein TadG-related protein [Flagellatimonas centrodinii]|uniref:pilus assembly protein TadG-related protein n=1 Tax=Flagellatimonas centrodinii TaxID=2806210 RepID=UPI001EFB083F|nr:pilus assembly protein TadG-related protein [Flagellatimonas centrodinii]ULQ47132.1 pilus assembly protein TadG-related protein [Flagellatimonas centrodinii]